MNMSLTIKLEFNRFPEIAEALPVETGEIVKETAYEIEGEAKVRAPVDTGALRASIETSHPARTRSEVATGVEYGVYQEYGTVKMPAQPFMTPAAEAARPRFMGKMRNLEDRLG